MAIISKQNRDVNVSGDFKTSSFKIKASAKAFEILSSNIYTNKVRAVIREYSCNAYDSHIEAGQDRPFDVHLPTMLEPWFSVRDYGTGLSEDGVRNVFCTYFQSTKDMTNDLIGGMGIGSKSFYSLCDSFTVTSYYNGEKMLFSCYKDEYGEPQVALLTTCETDEPNGLEVKMSIDNMESEFEDEAVFVYKYFDKLPNINNKEIAGRINKEKSDYDFISDELCLYKNYGPLYAVMGNVAYKVPSEYSKNLAGYIKFNIGDLSFNAGREELSMDESTKEKIVQRVQLACDTLAEKIYKSILEEKNSFLRAKKKAEIVSGSIHSIVKNSTKIYKKINDLSLPNLDEDTHGRVQVYSRSGWNRDSVETTQSLNVPIYSQGYNIRYFLHKDRMKTRINQWLKDRRNLKVVVLTQEQIDFFDIPSNLIEDLEQVIPKVSRSSGYNSVTGSSVCVWNKKEKTWRSKPRDSWDDVSVKNDGEERVYVDIYKYEVVLSKFNVNNFKDILECLEYLGIKTCEIYGIKNSFKKTKTFKNSNWISLDKYIERETKNLPVIENESDFFKHSTLFSKLEDRIKCKKIKKFNQIKNAVNKNDSKLFAYNTLKIEGKINNKNTLEKLSNEIEEAYPIIKLIRQVGTLTSNEVDILASYIK